MTRGQSPRQSLLEALTNTVIGFVIAFAAQLFIMHWYAIPTTLTQDLYITIFFTGISILRSYALRRLFNYLHTSN